MPKVYGSMLCPDCVEAKEYFEKEGNWEQVYLFDGFYGKRSC